MTTLFEHNGKICRHVPGKGPVPVEDISRGAAFAGGLDQAKKLGLDPCSYPVVRQAFGSLLRSKQTPEGGRNS